jgi:putative MFS transporter
VAQADRTIRAVAAFGPFGIRDRNVALAILVAALGYFVDIYDLLIFGVVRVASLRDIGVADSDMLSTGLHLINLQMGGILIGGFVWGVLGDRLGRCSVLFASILLYSVANLVNAFAHSLPLYEAMRFVSGVGLAGELGLSVTLVSELMPKEYRGWGATIIGSVGVMGAILAGLIGDCVSWRVAFAIGGAMGLALLLLRVGLRESGLFLSQCAGQVKRGNLFSLFTRWSLLKRYVPAILVPLPILAMIWLPVALTPEFARAFGASSALSAGTAIVFTYIGLTIGDALSGIISQKLRSRRKSIALFMTLLALSCAAHLFFRPTTPVAYYASCALMGFAGGYWIMAIQLAVEQFGTNIRATASTSIPTVSRALIIPSTLLFKMFSPNAGVINSAFLILSGIFILAALSLAVLPDSFAKDLDYTE